MEPEAATGAQGSQAAGLTAGRSAAPAAFVPMDRPPLDAQELAAAAASVDRRICGLAKVTKAELVMQCRGAGLPANNNDTKRKLLARLRGHFRELAEDAVRADSAARRGALGQVVAPRPSGGQALALAPHGAAPSGDRGGSPSPGCSTGGAGAPPPPTSRESSPVPPPGKRPRAEAPAFHPAATPSRGAPAGAGHLSGTIGAGRHRHAPATPAQSDPADVRRRSHAAASTRPARLDELLDVQAELRRRQVCLRGFEDAPDETPEHLEALVHDVRGVVEVLLGRAPPPMTDIWRVGRYAPDRPRPVIIRFERMADKVALLQAKGVLYRDDRPDYVMSCESDAGPLRLYHDLSPGQLDWKRRLRGAYEAFLEANTRVVWRRGYRLHALLEGTWVEFYPTTVLVH